MARRPPMERINIADISKFALVEAVKLFLAQADISSKNREDKR
jgi:hypothetical protein